MTYRIIKPLKRVVRYERYSPTNNPHPGYPCSIALYLECGHEQHRKASQGVPKKARCFQCRYGVDD